MTSSSKHIKPELLLWPLNADSGCKQDRESCNNGSKQLNAGNSRARTRRHSVTGSEPSLPAARQEGWCWKQQSILSRGATQDRAKLTTGFNSPTLTRCKSSGQLTRKKALTYILSWLVFLSLCCHGEGVTTVLAGHSERWRWSVEVCGDCPC